MARKEPFLNFLHRKYKIKKKLMKYRGKMAQFRRRFTNTVKTLDELFYVLTSVI